MGAPRASIGWMNMTFPPHAVTAAVVGVALSQATGVQLSLVHGPGLMGYAQTENIVAPGIGHGGKVGAFCHGHVQRGRTLLMLNARGADLVHDSLPALASMLETWEARLSRVDLVVDFMKGEYAIEDFLDRYVSGMFDNRGQRPRTSTAGDWLGGVEGRTLYIGNREAGKLLRVYEKGKQLGLAGSKWIRVELQLGRKERDLPTAVLLDPDAYFAGAYPALAAILPSATAALPARANAKSSDLARRLQHLKNSYGSAVDEAMQLPGATAEQLVLAIRSPRRGARDPPHGSWTDVLARLQRQTP